jgi:predicted metal-binding membrane protein
MRATNLTELSDPAQPRRRAPLYWPWVLVAAAWAIALLAALTGQTYLIDHDYLLEQSRLPWPATVAIFLAGWQVMTVAMMLPSSMPIVYMLVYASRQQARPKMAQVAFLAGYAVVWTAFAVVAFFGDTFIHGLVDRWPWLDANAYLIGVLTFVVAGAFQFSPLKERCLTACRSPFGFFVRYYRKGIGAAWHLGLRHGAFCLGCCWALMLVMFGIGVGSLVWMAALAGVMVLEKTIPGGQRLSPIIGIVLVLLAVVWLVQPLWLLRGGV